MSYLCFLDERQKSEKTQTSTVPRSEVFITNCVRIHGSPHWGWKGGQKIKQKPFPSSLKDVFLFSACKSNIPSFSRHFFKLFICHLFSNSHLAIRAIATWSLKQHCFHFPYGLKNTVLCSLKCLFYLWNGSYPPDVSSFPGTYRSWKLNWPIRIQQATIIMYVKVVWYPKMDQKVCLNMVKKDQLCGIALKKRNLILRVLLKMVAMETNHNLLR